MQGRVTLRRRAPLLAVCVAVLALALPAAAPATESAVVPMDGLYKGKTVQGKPVKFRLKGGAIGGAILFTVTGSAGCSLKVSYTFSKAKVASSGTFKLVTGGMTITGKYLTSTSVRGTLSAPSCTSAPKSVAYTAKRSA